MQVNGRTRGDELRNPLAVKRPDRRLLVQAANRRALPRIQVQPGHVGRLGLEVWIVRGDVAFEPMQFQAILGQDPSHRHVRGVAPQSG